MYNKTAISAAFLISILAPAAFAAESTGQYVDDATITTKVKAAFVGDSQLKSTDISVVTTHGIVALTGTVARDNQKTVAENDVNQVKGVKAVKDQLVSQGTD